MNRSALTVKGNGILRAIVSQVGISLPFTGDPKLQTNLSIVKFSGVWDTGATGSVITKKVVDALKLKPTGQKEVHTASGTEVKNTYLVNIALPMNVMVQGVTVTEGNLISIDVLIGMDIITLGDFAITNLDGRTVMSFQMPSSERIDYVERIDGERMQNMNREERRKFEAMKRKGKI